MKLKALLLVLVATAPAQASPWQFDAPVNVMAARPGVYHQLTGAGRSHVAVHGQSIVVVWEDNRSRQPQVYAALRRDNRHPFIAPIRLSHGHAAFEPAVVSTQSGVFVIAWEQDDAIQARILDQRGKSGPILLLAKQGSQVTLASREGRVVAVWSEPHGRERRLRTAVLNISGNTLHLSAEPSVVDPHAPNGAQPAYPTVSWTRSGIVVAWEDRRNVSSAIYYSHSPDGRRFSDPLLLNERRTPPPGARYGKGTTAMRVVLASRGDDGAVAIWLDKRTLGNSYDVYAAFSTDGGRRFGRNQKVQDDFADKSVQQHAVVTTRPGLTAVLWNDDRDGSQDIWLSWLGKNSHWEENVAVPGASGPGDQTHPSMVMDRDGNLHIIWLERMVPGGPTRLRYLRARFLGK